uniref:Uncharacterized protein n=1 Tax=viral metagenome TaxID=1070528 RepID=A0A6M3LL42_9ZZZZ
MFKGLEAGAEGENVVDVFDEIYLGRGYATVTWKCPFCGAERATRISRDSWVMLGIDGEPDCHHKEPDFEPLRHMVKIDRRGHISIGSPPYQTPSAEAGGLFDILLD